MRKIFLDMRILTSLLLATFILSACSALPRSWTRRSHFGADDLLSENPVYQIQAIRAVVEEQDQSQIPILLKIMIDGEASVRENAFWGLTQLTGLRKPASYLNSPSDGNQASTPEKAAPVPRYHSYDSLEERRAAVKAWAEGWKGNWREDPL